MPTRPLSHSPSPSRPPSPPPHTRPRHSLRPHARTLTLTHAQPHTRTHARPHTRARAPFALRVLCFDLWSGWQGWRPLQAKDPPVEKGSFLQVDDGVMWSDGTPGRSAWSTLPSARAQTDGVRKTSGRAQRRSDLAHQLGPLSYGGAGSHLTHVNRKPIQDDMEYEVAFNYKATQGAAPLHTTYH